MVHDRRIDGVEHTFGNAGALFMRAMTWWDHQTNSIWSQPWGRAIEGEYKGVELFILPSQLTSWGTWKANHPTTVVMANDLQRVGRRRQPFGTRHVVGLLLGDKSKAYYFKDAVAQKVINDAIGNTEIVVWADGQQFYAYLRQVGDQVLTFSSSGTDLIDDQTGSVWNPSRGVALDGPLQGETLQPVPSASAFDWAWRDFYPQSDFYTPP